MSARSGLLAGPFNRPFQLTIGLCNQTVVDLSLSRRGFLRTSAALLALSRLRAVPARAQAVAVPADAPLRVLSPRDARILGALAERITFTGEPDMPRFGDTAALQ